MRFKRFFASALAVIVAFVPLCSGVTVSAATDPVVTFVTSLYSDCLGRTPDEKGLNDWVTKLKNHEISGKQCAYGFFFSPEFLAKANALDDGSLIDCYYKVFLNRSADSSGKTYWTNKIANTTNDVSILFTGFADSTEFNQKCASYGITTGASISVPTTNRAEIDPYHASTPEQLDQIWTSRGYEIRYVDLDNGQQAKVYALFYDTTEHNNLVNAWRNENGLPSLNIITDPNDARYQYAKTRAVETAYVFKHKRPRSGLMTLIGGACSENIHSSTNGKVAFEWLRNSKGHNCNMLRDYAQELATASCAIQIVGADGVSIDNSYDPTGLLNNGVCRYCCSTVQLFYCSDFL